MVIMTMPKTQLTYWRSTMTTEETKERLVKIRKTLAEQFPIGSVILDEDEAGLLICLIDTVLRWDYEI